MIKAYSKFLDILEKIQRVILTVSVPAMVLIMFYQVVMRYVFHNSPAWSEELVRYLLEEFENDPQRIWNTDFFGKSLHDLVNEGLHNKLYRMPADARCKLSETIERIINEGCSGLICIIL